jgi:hypothetical protein
MRAWPPNVLTMRGMAARGVNRPACVCRNTGGCPHTQNTLPPGGGRVHFRNERVFLVACLSGLHAPRTRGRFSCPRYAKNEGQGLALAPRPPALVAEGTYHARECTMHAASSIQPRRLVSVWEGMSCLA